MLVLLVAFLVQVDGLILVPVFIYSLELDDKKARATSVFCILPMVLVTSLLYNKNNYINWNLGLKCAIGGCIGAVIGIKLLKRIPEKYLKMTFAVFLICVSLKMII